MAEEPPTDLITIQEATQLLGVTRQTLNNYIRHGQLRAYRLGGGKRGRVGISKAALLALWQPIEPTARGDKR